MWQLPLTNLNTLRFGRQFERGPDRGSSGGSSERWHLCNLRVSGGGISCKPVDAACRAQKHRKFLAMDPGQCSLWRDEKDTKVFAVCAGPPDSAQVLVMAADSVEEADRWVCSIAGRLYLSELQLEEEMITDYISIYYIFDTDGKGGISLDELQAASEGLGNPRSEHGHLTEELKATLTRLQIKTDAQGLISLPQFLKVRPLHDARASRKGLLQPFPPISQVLKEGLLQPSASAEDLLMQAFRLLDEDGTGSISREALAAWSKDALGTARRPCTDRSQKRYSVVPAQAPQVADPTRCHCAIRWNPMQALREKLTQKGFHRMTGQVPGGRQLEQQQQ